MVGNLIQVLLKVFVNGEYRRKLGAFKTFNWLQRIMNEYLRKTKKNKATCEMISVLPITMLLFLMGKCG